MKVEKRKLGIFTLCRKIISAHYYGKMLWCPTFKGVSNNTLPLYSGRSVLGPWVDVGVVVGSGVDGVAVLVGFAVVPVVVVFAVVVVVVCVSGAFTQSFQCEEGRTHVCKEKNVKLPYLYLVCLTSYS